jgi:glycosyltransferase involved in cell wall biosynthesis
MNVVLLHYASPPVVGGVETVLARQAELLVRAGQQVSVLTGRGAAWDARIPVRVLPELDSRHPQVLSLKEDLDRGVVPPEFAGMVDVLYAELCGYLANTDWLVAHNVASLHKNLALTAALCRFADSPGRTGIILWHHDFAWTGRRYESELHPGYPWDLLRTAWPGVRQVTISEARQAEMSALFDLPAEQISVVSNGVDMETFMALQPETRDLYERLDLVSAEPMFLAPVRLTRRKNLEFGLRIMAELVKRLPKARWVITGPLGAHNPDNLAYYRSLRDLRRELGLQKSVVFLAEFQPDGLSDAQIADLYRVADALLLTSQEEGFGLPVIEAGLARLVLFTSDIPPLRALGGEWATYFGLDESPAAAAARISDRLASDSAYQLRAHIRAHFTWDAIYTRQIAPLFKDSSKGRLSAC